MDLRLAGRTAVITGSSGGLGRGLVLGFAAEGCHVVLADRDLEQGERLAAQVSEQGGSALPLATDVTRVESVSELVARSVERFGRIDILVNNAGGGSRDCAFVEKDLDELRAEIELNVLGVVHCTRAIGAHMLEHGEGAIVNIASNAAVLGPAAVAVENYAGVKGYVVALSRALATSWGPRGVRLNCIAPGWIVPHAEDHVGAESFWTRFGYDAFGSLEALEEMARSGNLPSVNQQPIRQLGRPEDIAHLALFLASDCARHITGQLVSVSGGAYMP
ncbi:MAG: SDR family oxidoreductase [Deltaproteobacteria bacterium]|jgi:NAD(P)-dependent dehydrogenase (short-subunit alcohol dehydrogenase family)|nr:SDR family oxidoreductase [Deltaproteobacteria bacterium]MBW2499081.1 SDR family oxidoreductase [Deltaproteobacteria bacterium]